jgi:hypothetical protein
MLLYAVGLPLLLLLLLLLLLHCAREDHLSPLLPLGTWLAHVCAPRHASVISDPQRPDM